MRILPVQRTCRGGPGLRSLTMIGSGEPLDLAALVVPRAGALEATGVSFEPCRLLDPSGEVVGPGRGIPEGLAGVQAAA